LEQINLYLASKLKEERKSRKWSLDKTSAETGVSKAMLGQIERGESSPTVATLWKIATGFHTPLSHFLSPMNDGLDLDLDAKRSGAVIHQKISNEDLTVKTLSPYDNALGFEWFEITLLPNFESMSDPHIVGVTELITVIQGQMDVYTEGKWSTLLQGEAMRFAADKRHGYRNTTNEKVIFHDVILYRN